jgi:hypothetical protein
LAAPQGSPLSGKQEKHGLLFEWPRRKRSPFPCKRTVPFDNDMKRFLCHPTPSTTPGRLLIRWPQRVGLGRVSHGAYCCIRFYRSPVGSEEPLAESSQASLWEAGRSRPCPQAPGFSREVLDLKCPLNHRTNDLHSTRKPFGCQAVYSLIVGGNHSSRARR